MFRLAFAAVVGLAALQQQQQPPANMPGPITPPKLLSSDAPALPQCKGLTPAVVKLQFTVDVNGSAKDVKVVASPSDAHSACALAALASYQYVPAMQDLKAVAVQIVLTLNVPPGN